MANYIAKRSMANYYHHVPEWKEQKLDPKRLFEDQKVRTILFKEARARCTYCSTMLGKVWEADHLIPHKYGGATSIKNGVAACKKCNNNPLLVFIGLDQSWGGRNLSRVWAKELCDTLPPSTWNIEPVWRKMLSIWFNANYAKSNILVARWQT